MRDFTMLGIQAVLVDGAATPARSGGSRIASTTLHRAAFASYAQAWPRVPTHLKTKTEFRHAHAATVTRTRM